MELRSAKLIKGIPLITSHHQPPGLSGNAPRGYPRHEKDRPDPRDRGMDPRDRPLDRPPQLDRMDRPPQMDRNMDRNVDRPPHLDRRGDMKPQVVCWIHFLD